MFGKIVSAPLFGSSPNICSSSPNFHSSFSPLSGHPSWPVLQQHHFVVLINPHICVWFQLPGAVVAAVEVVSLSHHHLLQVHGLQMTNQVMHLVQSQRLTHQITRSFVIISWQPKLLLEVGGDFNGDSTARVSGMDVSFGAETECRTCLSDRGKTDHALIANVASPVCLVPSGLLLK